MASAVSSEGSLADRIVDAYATAVFDHLAQDFLPHSYIAKLITEAAIIEELSDEERHLDDEDDKALVRFILQRAKKVFATALVSGLEGEHLYNAMRNFKADNLHDDSLPLKKELISTLQCFSGKVWNKRRTYDFLKKQWIFLAPVFSKSKFKLDLEPEHIFPFTEVSNDVKEGAFSQVYKVKIHKAHQEDPTLTVAIKEIKDRRSSSEQEVVNKEWEAEAKALDEISGLNHPNIIQRIAAITRGSKRYFMFQWADGGSLGDFWKEEPRPSLDPQFIKEIVLQLRGLADALHVLHNYEGGSYRHGDLKPENILRFKESSRVGILKIADMGLAKHHVVATYLRPATSTRYGTVRYEPPEVFTHKLSEEGRSRLYDIWSMGCITLELIVWLLYGYEELMKFNNSIKGSLEESSPYFTVDKDDSRIAKVHPKVQSFMELMSKDRECIGNTAMKDLLDIVNTRLLVVPLPQHRPSFRVGKSEERSGNVAVIEPDARQAPPRAPGPTRATAQNFCDLLNEIIEKGKNDERYWFTGSPRDGIRPPRLVPPIVAQHLLSPDSAVRPSQLVDRRRDAFSTGLAAELAPSQRPNVSRLCYLIVSKSTTSLELL